MEDGEIMNGKIDQKIERVKECASRAKDGVYSLDDVIGQLDELQGMLDDFGYKLSSNLSKMIADLDLNLD